MSPFMNALVSAASCAWADMNIAGPALSRRTPAGLLSEDIDPSTGALWGNYPQTYSLVGLIQCAGLLSRPWSDAR